MKFEFTKKLLLVGDDSDVLDQVKIELENESENIDVIPASSPNKALKVLEEENFDGIISDYHLSEIGGIQFLDDVREDKKVDIPFIFFTGKRKQEIILKALEAGANRVLHRGDDIILFCKILNQTLGQEILNYKRKKELEHHRNKFDSNFELFRI